MPGGLGDEEGQTVTGCAGFFFLGTLWSSYCTERQGESSSLLLTYSKLDSLQMVGPAQPVGFTPVLGPFLMEMHTFLPPPQTGRGLILLHTHTSSPLSSLSGDTHTHLYLIFAFYFCPIPFYTTHTHTPDFWHGMTCAAWWACGHGRSACATTPRRAAPRLACARAAGRLSDNAVIPFSVQTVFNAHARMATRHACWHCATCCIMYRRSARAVCTRAHAYLANGFYYIRKQWKAWRGVGR